MSIIDSFSNFFAQLRISQCSYVTVFFVIIISYRIYSGKQWLNFKQKPLIEMFIDFEVIVINNKNDIWCFL